LTVVDRGAGWFSVDISAESVARTAPGLWREGARLNLERALRVGDELGGHIVTGHVDGTAEIVDVAAEGESMRLIFKAPRELARFIAPKGSIALDGVSLTVNEADGTSFGVNLIPHTLKVTTFGGARAHAHVNVEIDVLARYVARLAAG
ncbi:MAG TPA: riboflavin synthase, partial [Rhizomicrobium sp.]